MEISMSIPFYGNIRLGHSKREVVQFVEDYLQIGNDASTKISLFFFEFQIGGGYVHHCSALLRSTGLG